MHKVDEESVEIALRDLRNATQAVVADEYAYAIGFAGTAHGLLYATEARPRLEALRDALIDRDRRGPTHTPDEALEAALAAAHAAVSHVLDELENLR